MTQEEKLKEAKRLYKTANADQKYVLERLFPELAERGDEENIKKLIDELKCSLRGAKCQNEACNGGQEKRIALLEWAIAWLEKQGEQKPSLDVEIPFGAKDSDLQEERYFIPNGFHAEIIGDKVVIKKGEQKPAEWSEEDKDMLGMLLEMINYASDHYQHDDKATDIKAWVLKSLKDRVQPKQEWSEEDLVAIDSAVDALSKDLPSLAASLRRIKYLSPQNSWEPSFKQMQALLSKLPVIRGSGNEAEKILETLYIDLKKLRKE